MNSAALILAVVLAADGGMPDLVQVESAVACAAVKETDAGWSCDGVRAELLPSAWWMSREKLVRIGARVNELESENARTKAENEQLKRERPEPATTPSGYIIAFLLGATAAAIATAYAIGGSR